MTTIYLIRHAEAEGNLYRIAQGQKNSNLTDRGWRQVKALEKRFAPIHIDAVYTSDLYRTCATASAIYLPKNLPVHRVKGLREINVGQWEERTWGDIYRESPEQMDYFSHQFHKWHIDGAETPRQVLDRMLDSVTAIARENEGRTVAVFSHGYAIRLLLAHLQGYTLETAGATPHGDNTAVSLLEYDGGAMHVVFRDDNSHLTTPEFLSGEKVRKRANALEPGLWFAAYRPQEEAPLLTGLVQETWADASRPFDSGRLLRDAAQRATLVGYLASSPVGAVQMGEEPGWMTLACIRPECRKRGFGTQLIGQAVLLARRGGADALHIRLMEGSAAEAFFEDCGFHPASDTEGGFTVWEKNIAFRPEFYVDCAENV